MTAIQVRKTGEEPGSASLAVTVPVEEVREAEERATTSYQQRARLPGFRRGKAPPALVRKHFAEDIRQETLQQLIRASWKVALEQETLQPIADPHIHNLKWEGGGTPVTFEFHVEVKPDVKLERIGKFHLKRKVAPVTDEQVVAQLNELRAQKAPWTPVAGEKPKPKDLVHVTIAAREGAQVKDPQPYQLVLGEGRAIPEVEERIMGMLPGETLDATVRFPDDFPEEAKRGQTRDIRLTLHEVKRQQLHLVQREPDVARLASLRFLGKVVRKADGGVEGLPGEHAHDPLFDLGDGASLAQHQLVGLRVLHLVAPPLTRRDRHVHQVLGLRLLARDGRPRRLLLAQLVQLRQHLLLADRRDRPRETELPDPLELQVGRIGKFRLTRTVAPVSE